MIQTHHTADIMQRFPALLLALVVLLAASPCYASRPTSGSLLPSSHPDHTRRDEDSRGGTRRSLDEDNPLLTVDVVMKSPPNLEDEEIVSVFVDGIQYPDKGDWIGMMTPQDNISVCPFYKALYAETGDHSDLPQLCTYPIKSQFLSNDPDYLPCHKSRCSSVNAGYCDQTICAANITFHITNIRTNILFILFTGGFQNPRPIAQSREISFKNLYKPLYPRIAIHDSSGTTMRVTWVSATNSPQYVKYGGDGKTTTTIAAEMYERWDNYEMCGGTSMDYGYHDPGYAHSVVMTDLKPAHEYFYSLGSDVSGWTGPLNFKTPHAGGSDENICFLIVADMGRASLDLSVEHYTRPTSLPVINAMLEEVRSGNIDDVFHLGGLSYATGFIVGWDYFLRFIDPIASHVPYMTAVGNHERDYPSSMTIGSRQLQPTTYSTTDSGGECGIPYDYYFRTPNEFLGDILHAKDKPWYSFEQGNVHFTIISTEHDWKQGSEQYMWFRNDVDLLNRSQTPWLIVMGHRPMYSSVKENATAVVDPEFQLIFEDQLHNSQVDLAIFGHVYNYERSCSIYQETCISNPVKDDMGLDVYNNTKAPVHVVVGTGGFSLETFIDNPKPWSLVRIARYGYLKVNATRTFLDVQFIDAMTFEALDCFIMTKS